MARWSVIPLALVASLSMASSCSSETTVTTGASCSTNADCSNGELCVYKIVDGCAATPVCQPQPTGTLCGAGITYCGCSGKIVTVGCGDPSGYAAQPVSGPGLASTCGPQDAGGE